MLALKASGKVRIENGVLTINNEEVSEAYTPMLGECAGNEPSALPEEIKCEEGVVYSLKDYRRLRVVIASDSVHIKAAYLLK